VSVVRRQGMPRVRNERGDDVSAYFSCTNCGGMFQASEAAVDAPCPNCNAPWRYDTDRAPAPAPIDEPDVEDFLEGLKREVAYQAERWEERDRKKTSAEWFVLLGRLAFNALGAATVRDRRLALHHVITAAAALGHWHAAIRRDVP